MYELILVDAVSVIFVYYKFICMSISFWKYKILYIYYGYIIYNINMYLWLICCNRLYIKVLSDISEKVFVWKLVDN